MNVKQIRVENLKRHIAERSAGNQRKFADDYGFSKAHLSQIVNGHRDMGDKIARKVESKLALNPGDMDKLAGAAPLVARQDLPNYADPRARELAALFFWLTAGEQTKLMQDVKAKAAGNRLIAREIGQKLNPPTDKHVKGVLDSKRRKKQN